MRSLLPSILILGLAALAAVVLARSRPSRPEVVEERSAAARTLALATAVQAVHFTEELATGFPERLGALLGLPAMPLSFFVTFNLGWLAIWILSVWGIRSAHTLALFAAWFLAIAALINAVAHPLLAIAEGGYFPGLVTSPLIGAAGVWLWFRLREATHPA